MKRKYTTPSLEKVEFNYSEQIVAQSGTKCGTIYINNDWDQGGNMCCAWIPHQVVN